MGEGSDGRDPAGKARWSDYDDPTPKAKDQELVAQPPSSMGTPKANPAGVGPQALAHAKNHVLCEAKGGASAGEKYHTDPNVSTVEPRGETGVRGPNS